VGGQLSHTRLKVLILCRFMGVMMTILCPAMVTMPTGKIGA
jgi:hypothetical protein